MMNFFLEQSIAYGQQCNYKYDLAKVYPTILEKSDKTAKSDKEMFCHWVKNKSFGFPLMNMDEFSQTKDDGILCASSDEMTNFAINNLGYLHENKLDFIARICGQYVIGVVHLITNKAQREKYKDAISLLESNVDAVKIAILDGALYTDEKCKMYKESTTIYGNYNIMSALMLRTFLFSVR